MYLDYLICRTRSWITSVDTWHSQDDTGGDPG